MRGTGRDSRGAWLPRVRARVPGTVPTCARCTLTRSHRESRTRMDAPDGTHPQPEPTELLRRFRAGDAAAGERLLPLVYRELHRLAEVHMAGQPAHHTLQPTALVNEAYLRLVAAPDSGGASRAEFFSLAS